MLEKLLILWKRKHPVIFPKRKASKLSVSPRGTASPEPETDPLRHSSPIPDSMAVLPVTPITATVKNLPAMQETWDRSLGQEKPLEEGMATRASILAWRIPWTEEPGGLQPKGSQKSQTGLSDFHSVTPIVESPWKSSDPDPFLTDRETETAKGPGHLPMGGKVTERGEPPGGAICRLETSGKLPEVPWRNDGAQAP